MRPLAPTAPRFSRPGAIFWSSRWERWPTTVCGRGWKPPRSRAGHGGLDALGAARLSGLESVVYTGSKPPRAWKGTKAESLLALDTIDAPAAFYEGTAREAAQLYPQNANVAAAVALAGAGFEATRVRLVADPGLTLNVHEIAVRATCANFTIRLEGRPSPANPKTSLTAGYSLARSVLNASGRMVVA
jgi:aspartate dehydrogenase